MIGEALSLLALDLDHGDLQAATSCISTLERCKADRFRSALHRARYIRGRAALRQALAAALAQRPSAVALETQGNGKPMVRHAESLAFNFAHSEQRAIIVLGQGRALGVDIELQRALPHRDAIARRYFATAELAELAAALDSERDRAFLSCWTRKEAYLKMLGTGLTGGIANICVGMDSGSPTNVPAHVESISLFADSAIAIASDRPWAALTMEIMTVG